jgi:hypothetical protein
MVPYAAVADGRAVSLDDALRPPTHAEIVRAARNALDVDRHAERYPEINNDSMYVDGEWQPSPRRDMVEDQLRPINEALGSEGLTSADRERLVSLGHNIMGIANQSPENLHRGAVLNPERAEHMAYAMDEHLQKPSGFRGRHRAQNQLDADSAAYYAGVEYDKSLRQSSS